MKNKFLILFLFFPFILAANFINMNWGARGMAMGNAFTALTDSPTSIFWNPAGLAKINSISVIVSHQNLYGIPDLYNEMIALSVPLPYVHLGLGTTQLSLTDVYREQVNYLSAASIIWMRNISLRFGLNIKNYIAKSQYPGSDAPFNFDLDFGLNAKLNKKLQFAWVIRNITEPAFKFIQMEDRITREYICGINYSLLRSVNISGDYSWSKDGNKFKVGGEMWFYDVFAPRIGMDGGNFTAGFGLKSNKWSLDGAVLANDALGSTYRLSFSWRFTR